MTEERLEKFRNGLDYMMDSPVIKYVLVGACVLALVYASGFIMQLVTTVVVAYKGLAGALKKPV